MNARVHSRIGTALFVFGIAAATGCGRTAPTSPSSAAAPVGQSIAAGESTSIGVQMARRGDGSVVGFPLLDGRFTISNDSGDSITGTYTGTSFVSAGSPERAVMNLQLSGGTGAYAGASGALGASGVGVFTGEGSFTLDVKGDALVHGKHVPVRVDLAGTSSVACTASSEIAVSLTGTGSMKKTGDVHATFAHIVGQASCQS